MKISKPHRNALRDAVLLDLKGISDLETFIAWERMTEARGYRDRFMHDMRLLDDLGWEEHDDRESFELTMQVGELAPLIWYLDEVSEGLLRHWAEDLLVGADPDMSTAERAELERIAHACADADLDTRSACRAVLSDLASDDQARLSAS